MLMHGFPGRSGAMMWLSVSSAVVYLSAGFAGNVRCWRQLPLAAHPAPLTYMPLPGWCRQSETALCVLLQSGRTLVATEVVPALLAADAASGASGRLKADARLCVWDAASSAAIDAARSSCVGGSGVAWPEAVLSAHLQPVLSRYEVGALPALQLH